MLSKLMQQLIVSVEYLFEVYFLWQIAGIHPENCKLLKTDKSTEYALSPELLSEAISHDIAIGLIPFFLCGTVSNKDLYVFFYSFHISAAYLSLYRFG